MTVSETRVGEVSTVEAQPEVVAGPSANTAIGSGSARAYGQGHFNVDIPVQGVNSNTVVIASVTEVYPNGNPNSGWADVSVENVIPREGSIRVRVFVDFTSALNIRISYIYVAS